MAPKNHRLCVSCRKTLHKDDLWRIVRTSPNRVIQIDEGMGRSAYVCPTEECVQAMQKKNRLGRVLRSPIPPHIFQSLESRLEPRLEPLSHENRLKEHTQPAKSNQ